ncbi:MAG: glutamate-1-semialdehyde 2,1-aminomutase [Candidatus Portnoybacteria bacterium RBG_13_40_8]|uniref:Glutamate-1-semialdehyde 2,1-aminomutase n=1 Tax=Candidatus Portnoybacteria bacterium RBG_13_40_8 TaxID=1801990 RepID=A0A1G2F2R1_9BACT|nr:MAG: glutamate-1-semialdehyde 2,1-aminomutase [Candidatus Portnoybacteria bacterium RBG_13_40_8]
MSENQLREKAHALIPGGAHTYSRGDDQFPENAPALVVKGKGCYIWGSNGEKYLDYGMGLRTVTIGYATPEIDNAAIAEIRKGTNLTKSSLTELDAAEKVLKLFKGMDMVKFAKNGSTVTTAAVKLARAYTDRKYILRCIDHPFFSYDDWFIGDTVVKKGIPEEISSLTINFKFNDIESVKQAFRNYPNQIACVIMEPTTHIQPENGFLKEVADITHKNGAVFISDEISCTFRTGIFTTLDQYGVTPDLVTVGKGMANGYPLTALVGKKEIMNLGGIKKEGEERVFLISTTYGGELISLGAIQAVIDYYKKHDVLNYLWSYNKKFISGINKISSDIGIEDKFYIEGFPGRMNYVAKDNSGKSSFEFRTLFHQEMVKNKILIPWIVNSYAHGDKELKMTFDAVTNSLEVYKKALKAGLGHYLKGKPQKPVFRQFN